MKGNDNLLHTPNSLLANKLTGINQYMFHAEMSENWDYETLHEHFQKRASDERGHTEQLIARVLFLKGTPSVDQLRTLSIGSAGPRQLDGNHKAEAGAIETYNEGIVLATRVADNATRELLESILVDEDWHSDETQEKQDQIQQMGEQLSLSAQVSCPSADCAFT